MIALVVEKIANTELVVIGVPLAEQALAGGTLVDVAVPVGRHRDHAGHARLPAAARCKIASQAPFKALIMSLPP